MLFIAGTRRNSFRRYSHIYIFLLALFCVASASADNQSEVAGPYVCLGFLQNYALNEDYLFGTHIAGNCPKEHAITAAHPMAKMPRSIDPALVRASYTCCRLPHADILTEEHAYYPDECPAGFVATGQRNLCDIGKQQANWNKCVWELRCTKVNSRRYQLSETTPAAHWGSGTTHWKHKLHIFKRDIPSGLRYALGRVSTYEWGPQGCVGFPFDSILVRKEGKRCHNFHFRQLQYRGVEGDPEKGTTVQLFPRCDSIDNVFRQTLVCQ